jgi:hypothetical protein
MVSCAGKGWDLRETERMAGLEWMKILTICHRDFFQMD